MQDEIKKIYDDLAANVTFIHNRQNLHLALDLVWHSPLSFRFGKKIIKKGFPELLVVGDTRCGKSETASALLKHYRLGAKASGENASKAGLVGGMEQINKKWRVSWGRIPLNNKRLLIIDEASSLKVEQIADMSNVRSECIAEISKIGGHQRTEAYTRLIWLSNTRDGGTIGSYGTGMRIIEHLIGNKEDVARFDLAIIIDKDELTVDQMDERYVDEVPHIYTSDLCHALVLWCWSRRMDQVIIGKSTYNACFDLGKKMSEKYSEECPLVNRSEQKLKLCRLAAGLAGRLFSTDSSGEKLIVLPEHVEYVYNFMCYEYDKPHFGYNTFSARKKQTTTFQNPKEVVNVLAEMSGKTAEQLLETYQITVKSIEESTGQSYELAKHYVSVLLKEGALRKTGTYYTKTTAFNKVLKEFIHDPTALEKEF